VAIEELESVAIELDGAPGVGIDHGGAVGFEFLEREVIGTAVEVGSHTANGTSVGLDRLATLALEFQGGETLRIELLEAGLFHGIHGTSLDANEPH
jgi:hypothetical protein